MIPAFFSCDRIYILIFCFSSGSFGAMKEIEHLLGMEGLSRVEAFDISNINGFETVGSMIVYEK